MPEAAAPRVFISYSHDSPDHRDRVFGIADRLRADGINAIIDQADIAHLTVFRNIHVDIKDAFCCRSLMQNSKRKAVACYRDYRCCGRPKR
jgi:hypothetical protein